MTTDGIKRIIGPTILLRSGTYFDFENPKGSAITIHDIANALSHICRFTGHCHTFYSVAEHSVHCSNLVPEKDAYAALMHDAAEAVMGDVSRPLKSLLPDYKRIEKRVEEAILAKFGLPAQLPASVKEADMKMLRIEQRECMLNHDDWFGTSPIVMASIVQFLPPVEAYAAFIKRFHQVRTHD